MSAPAASDSPRIFVSHSHSDNAYCRAFVAELRRALGGREDAVWYDEHNLGWGNIRRTIERELEQRQHFIAILSPAAVESQWVNDEIDAALGLLREGRMQTISFVTAAMCDVPRLLRGYKRVELAGGDGYPPDAAAARVLRFIRPGALPASSIPSAHVVMPRVPEPVPMPLLPSDGGYDRLEIGDTAAPTVSRQSRYTGDLELSGILTPAVMRRELFTERLERLGFTAWTAKDAATGKWIGLILPPLCPVPVGPFLMGSNPQQDHVALASELPQHAVTLPAYQIATFPVTVAEYAGFVAAGRPAPRKGILGPNWQSQLTRPDHPVSGVTWHDARDYAAWLAKLTGQPWALPSEAEWEKAARVDTSGNSEYGVARIYPWGDDFDAARCNTLESRVRATTAVGTYGPRNPAHDGSSPCGAQDMAGNVWEWTRSVYDAQAYGKEPPSEDGDAVDEQRVRRGGSWRTVAKNARAAYRNSGAPDYAGIGIGFREVLLSTVGLSG